MARKVYYSKPLKHFWDYYNLNRKRLPSNLSDDQVFEIIRNNILNAPNDSFENNSSKQIVMSGWEMWRSDSKGEILHIFFLDKELRDRLESMQLSDLRAIISFLKEKGKNRKLHHLYSNQQSDHLVFQFAIKIPYESEGYAFSLSFEEDGNVQLYFSIGENGGIMSNKFYEESNKKQDEISLTQTKMFRLAINTIAYMECFPDCVDDGVPENLYIRSEILSGKNKSLQMSEKLKDSENSNLSPRPHPRRPHLRWLGSDYFTHKKGKLIFVKGSMVKAKAKTVKTSNDLDSFTEM